MAAIIVTMLRRQGVHGNFELTLKKDNGRTLGNLPGGNSPQEAAAEVARLMLGHDIGKARVLAPPAVMKFINEICPGSHI